MYGYNYREEMKKDIREEIKENYNLAEWAGDRDGLEEKLNDELWIADNVTGNASGSYTFNSWKAKEYVTDNEEDLQDAIREFGVDAETVAEKFLDGNWEYFDVTIRCYLLGECIAAVLDEMEEEGAFDEPENMEG